MKRSGRFIVRLAGVVGLVSFTGTAGGDLAPQSQVAFTSGGLGTSNANWQGVGGRTYFMQWSPDMVTWHYAPLIEFGTGGHGRGLDSSSAKFLVRLHYGDFPGITSLDEAMSADPDEDGQGNASELAARANPMMKDNPMLKLEVTVE